MSLAFAGTPRFASWVLRELTELGRAPALVISQPDRPSGRGRSGSAPHAVREAICLGLDCLQADNINSPDVLRRLRSCGVDTLAVAAFGQRLAGPLLEGLTCINIHASLLPRYRGAAPIERALMGGETVTGVSIMKITERLDEGPWAQQVEVSISPREDAGSLGRVLAVIGAVALAEVLDSIEDGSVEWRPQEGVASYAHKLGQVDCWLDPRGSAKRAHDQVRALSPEVGARASLGDTAVKIWRSWPHGQAGFGSLPRSAACAGGQPGKVVIVEGRLFIGCQEGALEIMEIQPTSRARMSTSAFLRGYAGRIGGQMTPAPAARG